MFSAFNPSKCTHTWSSGQPTQWRPGSSLEVWCLAQGAYLSHGQFLPEPRFEPTTSGYKSDALSIRATTALELTFQPSSESGSGFDLIQKERELNKEEKISRQHRHIVDDNHNITYM